jgi:hypothetical protein
VPEGVEADPGLGAELAPLLDPLAQSSLHGCRLEHAAHQVGGVDAAAASHSEDELIVGGLHGTGKSFVRGSVAFASE